MCFCKCYIGLLHLKKGRKEEGGEKDSPLKFPFEHSTNTITIQILKV